MEEQNKSLESQIDKLISETLSFASSETIPDGLLTIFNKLQGVWTQLKENTPISQSKTQQSDTFNDDLQDEIMHLEAQVATALEQTRLQTSKAKILEFEKSKLKQDFDNLSEELQQCQKEIHDKSTELNKIHLLRRNAVTSLADMKRQWNEAKQEVHNYKTRENTYKADILRLKDLTALQEQDLHSKSSEINLQSRQYRDLQNQLAAESKKVNQERTQKNSLKQKIVTLENSITQLKTSKDDLTIQVVHLSRDIRDSETQIQLHLSKIQQARVLRDELERQIIALEKKTIQQASENANKSSLIKGLNSDIAELKASLKTTETAKKQLESTINNLKESLNRENFAKDQYATQAKQIEQQATKLNQDLQEKSAHLSTQLKNVQHLESNKNELLAQVAKQVNKVDYLVNVIHQKDAEILALCAQNESAESKYSLAVKSLESERTLHNSVKNSLKVKITEIEKVQLELLSLQTTIQEQNTIIKDCKSQIEDKSNQIIKLQQTIDMYCRQIDLKSNEIQQLSLALDIKSTEFLKLKLTLNESVANGQRLNKQLLSAIKLKETVAKTLSVKESKILELGTTIDKMIRNMNHSQQEYQDAIKKYQILKQNFDSMSVFKKKYQNMLTEKETLITQIHQLEKLLTEEKQKLGKLQIELQALWAGGDTSQKMRLKRLEAEDKQSFQLMQKVHELQRRLKKLTKSIEDKNEQLSESEIIIGKLEKEIQSCKVILNKKSTPTQLEEPVEAFLSAGGSEKQSIELKNLQVELKLAHKRIEQYQRMIMKQQKQILDFRADNANVRICPPTDSKNSVNSSSSRCKSSQSRVSKKLRPTYKPIVLAQHERPRSKG